MRELFQTGGPAVDYYDLLHSDPKLKPIEGDVEFYRRHAKAARGPVLELGCGTGRVLLPLARAGIDITGLDLSPHMLRVAKAKLDAEPRLRATLVRGTMERFALARRFALVIIPFRAFQHLMTPRAQRRCLDCVHRHLRPGGRLIVDLFDPRLDFCLPSTTAPKIERRPAVDPRTGHRIEFDVRDRRNDPLTQTFRERWVWMERDHRGEVIRCHEDALTLRWTYRFEMQHLLELAGFEPVACHGDFKGGRPAYGAEQVWVAKRV